MMGTLEGIEIKGFNKTANLEADLCQILSIMPANLKSLQWAILDLERASELNSSDPLEIDQGISASLKKFKWALGSFGQGHRSSDKYGQYYHRWLAGRT